MTYRGTVQNGVVVFKAEAPPDGADVQVEVLGAARLTDRSVTPEELKAFWDELMTFAGKAEGLPSDLAERHDHYRRERQKR